MFSPKSIGLLLLVLLGVGLCSQNVSGVVIYRIGTPFSTAEKDSLAGLGIDFREIDWSVSQLQDGLDLDSLPAGSLQPNYFDEDEDIAATLLSRGGWVRVRLFANQNKLIGEVLVDGDPTTGLTWPAVAPESFQVGTSRTLSEQLTFDLGGRFLIREVRFRPLAEKPEHFVERLSIGSLDERLVNIGNRMSNFPTVAEVKENTEPEVSVILDPPLSTQTVQLLIFRDTPKEIGLADFELYGGGFVARASYESEVVDLGGLASWGEMRWSGRQDTDARVNIRTRTGADPHPDIFWQLRPEQRDSVQFRDGGGDLTLSEYKRRYSKLLDVLKPVKPQDRVSPDTENWSFWSSPYLFENSGTSIVSPSPRQFLQLKVDFFSTIEDGGKIDYVEFRASVPPTVHGLVGEIFPVDTRVGQATHFTYFIRPTIRAGDMGFDGVEISTPSGVISVDSLRIDGINYNDFIWAKTSDGLGFEINFPRKLEPTDSGALIEVVFNAPVLREVGTLFTGKVFNSAEPNEVRQRINPGNAADEIESDGIAVKTSLSSSLVFAPQIGPNPFTPNGDAINDVVHISYKLLRVTSQVPVSVAIFDLSGRLVKQIYAGDIPIGEYSHSWDGTDHSNRLVPPGLYLYRIAVDIQSEEGIKSGVIAVAY